MNKGDVYLFDCSVLVDVSDHIKYVGATIEPPQATFEVDRIGAMLMAPGRDVLVALDEHESQSFSFTDYRLDSFSAPTTKLTIKIKRLVHERVF